MRSGFFELGAERSASQLLEAAIYNLCLFFIARGPGVLANRFVRLGITGLTVESLLLQTGKGIGGPGCARR